MRVGSDRDAQTVARLRSLEVAQVDLPFAEGIEECLRFQGRGRLRKDEVRFAGGYIPATANEFLREAQARGDNLGRIPVHPLDVVHGGKGHGLGESVHIIGVLDLIERGNQVRRADAIAHAKPCKREALRECAHDNEVSVAVRGRKTHAVRPGKIGVGLVHKDDPLEVPRKRGDCLRLCQRSRRRIGVRPEEEGRLGVEGRRIDRPCKALTAGNPPDVANCRERLVERVARVERGDALVVLNECPRRQGEDFIGTVSNEDILRLRVVEFRKRGAQVGEVGIRVASQEIKVEPFEDACTFRGRWVRVLVRVELDDALCFRLLTGRVRL